MEVIFLLTVLITVLYGLFKFISMKYLEKEIKPLKHIIKDATLVFLSSLVILVLYFGNQKWFKDFFSVITSNPSSQPELVQVFTGNPDF